MGSHATGNKNAATSRLGLVLAALASASLLAAGATGVEAQTSSAASAFTDVSAVRSIEGLNLRRQASLRSLEIVSDGPVIWTSFRDNEGRLIVELPNAQPTKKVLALDLNDELVRSAFLEIVSAGQRPMSRLVVDTVADVSHAVVPRGDRLILELTPVDLGEAAGQTASHGELEVKKAAAFQNSGSGEPEFGPAPSGVPATQLQGVDVTTGDELTTVWIAGDGAFYYSYFPLAEPYRFVVDLIGVVNTSPVSTIAVQGQVVDRVRVAQYKPQPELVSRVVIDLMNAVAPSVEATVDGLKLTFTASEVMAAGTGYEESMEPEPVALTETEAVESALDTSYDPAPEAAEELAEVVAEPGEPTAVEEAEELTAEAESVMDEEAVELPQVADTEPAPVWEEPEADRPAMAEEAEMPATEPAEDWQEPVEDVAEPAWAEEPVWEEEPFETAQTETPEPVADAPTWDEPESEAEPAWEEPEDAPTWDEPEDAPTWDEPEAEPMPAEVPSGSLFDVSVDLTPEAAETDGDEFGTRDVTVGVDRVYTGEPMTLTLQDADVKDVLRSFAQISGLNVVVQPGVTGSVTVEFTDVPWDQALDQILKINGLDYELEGNIMRVAPVETLRKEAEERARLQAAKALSIPLKTILRRVSYASADEIAGILRSGGGASIMSERGSVVVDLRTNTLIIKELPSQINTVIAVIENLDIPEPQVSIEARIIETTKRFSQTLGIQLGFNAISDVTRGNTTGLQFPNNGTAEGGVNLLTGGSNGILDITLGNVLNTFNLDMLLQAAESEGLINILSAPRITTLNNEQASIQSGLQIPIQTIANNTVSVQFVNATLRLDVTPHVTAEGTVLMDIDIQKREPQLAFAVVGASNAPIATKDATTRVIVRDGGTTVIGGIYKVTSDQGEDRVPGLSNVPIIKHLFKNKRRNDENEELLIFITPRVVKL